MKWGLLIGNRAKRQLRRLSVSERHEINGAFSDMCDNPFEGDIKFLGGRDGLRRRVGDWRILFDLDRRNHVIKVISVKRRGSNSY
jgi:mRNA-degrading endonuclease RelE of RelBE toxin-antitoxin system